VAAWREAHPDEDVFEDRRLEITSHRAVSADEQIAAVEAALARHGEQAGNTTLA